MTGASALRRPLALIALAWLILAPATASAAQRCPDCWRAGAASLGLRVPEGTPLAGYGASARRLLIPDFFDRHPHAFWFKPHDGALDPPAARALVLEADGQRLIWIAADLVAVDRVFTAAVRRRLIEQGIADGTLVISASHTHSGPGAFLDSRVLGVVSVERGDPAVHEALVDSLVEAVRRADAAKVAARLGATEEAGPPLTIGRLGGPVDQRLAVLKITGTDGAPIAALWNYAIHGTMLGPRNLRLSGDVMGLASRQLEQTLGVPALFVNGAVGDVSPQRHGLEEARVAAATLAAAVVGAWRRIEPAGPARLAFRSARLALPAPHLSVRNCLSGVSPAALSVPLGSILPRETELIAGALGDTAWVAIPGELQSSLGEAIKRDTAPPWRWVLISGVSNDYLGYFLTPTGYGRPSYIACASLYGPDAGERVANAARDLLRALAGAR